MNSLETNKDNQSEVVMVESVEIQQTSEEQTAVKNTQLSKEELVEELRKILLLPIGEIKDKVNELKQNFYQIYNAEQEQKRKMLAELPQDALVEPGAIDVLEVEFKSLMKDYKQRKATYNNQIEQEKEQNKLRKEHVIEQMKALLEKNTDVSNNVQEFRNLQQSWKEIGQVSATVSNDLWKQYNLCQESFYDLLKINQELREYDFKKNLEAKTLLCESAEKLSEQNDVVAAFRELQRMHDEWKAIGPVSREVRESIWARFQAASLVINKKHQDFFSNLHSQEKENLEQKTKICEAIEAMELDKIETFKLWEEKNKEIVEIQAQWRAIGFAPRKENQQIYERYRALCDRFFAAKNDFYKKIKSELLENLNKKRTLCEKAEALKDSTDWKVATDQMVQLQKEWKSIGSVPKKYSDEVWKQFIAACDYFFERKKANTSDHQAGEKQNLIEKIAIVEQLENFERLETTDASIAALKELTEKYNAIGFVPFKEKDKLYKRFKDALNKHYEVLNVDVQHRRLDNFRTNLKDMETQGETKLLNERRRLLRAYDNLKNEIATTENNMGFFTMKSKKSIGLLKDVEQKMNVQRKELSLIEQKINIIDEKLNS